MRVSEQKPSMAGENLGSRATQAAIAPTEALDWANDPRRVDLAETMMSRAMRRGDHQALASHVMFLQEKGLDIQAVYERARVDCPNAPTLPELEADLVAARAEQP